MVGTKAPIDVEPLLFTECTVCNVHPHKQFTFFKSTFIFSF